MKQIDYKLFKKINGITNLDIAKYLGVSEVFVSMVTSGKTKFSQERLAKLLDHPLWETSPLLNTAREENPTYPHPLNLAPTEKPSTDLHIPDTSEPTPNNMPAWLPISKEEGEVEMVNAEEVPYIGKAVIESRELDLKAYIESGNAKTIIPQGLVQQGVDYAYKIYSDAMAPDIREGDIVLYSFVPDPSNLVDGDTYALDTTKYGCVIRDIKHDGDEIILIARNHKYPNLRVKQSEILNVAIPMQLIRSTFSQRTDYSKIIRDKDERIDLLVNREFDHIRHTDKLLEQIDRVTAQQGKLIEALVEKK